MKRIPKTIGILQRSVVGVIMMLAGGFYAQRAMAQTDGTVELNAKILDYTGDSTKEHWTVVWVTTGNNTFIKTIWRQGPSIGSSHWNSHCSTWYQAKNGSTAFDGYSSATAYDYNPPNNSPIIEQWNCRDASGNLVPDGTYKFWIQYAEDAGQGPYTTTGLLWTKGPGSGSTTNNYPNQGSNFSNMSVVWSPVYVPPPDAAITSASVQGSNMVIVGTGTVSAAYTVIGSSYLDDPLGSWISIQSGTISGTGSFSNALPIMPFASNRYYRIRLP